MQNNLAIQQLSFDLSDNVELSEASNSAYHKRYSPLWLTLYLPSLSLDLQMKDIETPQLVIQEVKGKHIVYYCCHKARQLGISSGMTLSSAYALSEQIITYHRNNEKEQRILNNLADWAQQFTPSVNIDTEKNSVLLEIRASLELFGGILSLKEKISELFKQEFSYKVNYAIAPTPLASQVLSQFIESPMKSPIVEKEAELRSILGKLPINALLLENKKTEIQLKKIGIETLKELWRLPRNSLARRFGKQLISHLDKLLGEQASPLKLHYPVISFDRSIELTYEASDIQAVYTAAKQLLEHLQRFLVEHDSGVMKLYFRLYYFDKNSQDIEIGLRQCSRNAKHILLLLQEHLNRLTLQAPVCEVRLIINKVLPFIAHNQDIFSSTLSNNFDKNSRENDPEWQSLMEQLQNRFKLQTVQYPQIVDEHRPEFACLYQQQMKKQDVKTTKHRPLWLLPEPKRLPQKGTTPYYSGILIPQHGPERIESGWWENNETRRDYYIALDTDNRRLWIYRDINKKQWYLHGFMD